MDRLFFFALGIAILLSGCDSSYDRGELKALGFYAVVDGHLSPLFERSKSGPEPISSEIPNLVLGRDYLILYGTEPATFLNSGFSMRMFVDETRKWSEEMNVDGQMSREPEPPFQGQPITKYVPRPTMQPTTYLLQRWITDEEKGESYFNLLPSHMKEQGH